MIKSIRCKKLDLFGRLFQRPGSGVNLFQGVEDLGRSSSVPKKSMDH